MQYIQQRNHQYYLRFKTPQSLKCYSVLPLEITKTLHTDSYTEACVKIASKLHIINRIKSMSHNISTISSPELLALYKELTDFKEIDSASSAYRSSCTEYGGYDAYSHSETDVRHDLQDGGGRFDFSDVTVVQPNKDNITNYRTFESLFLKLVDARDERFFHGHTETFDNLLSQATKLIPELNEKAISTNITPSEKPYLLSEAWSDFKKHKNWTPTRNANNERFYEFMLCLWGDINVRTITKQNLRQSLSRYCQLPKTNAKPYYQWSMTKLMSLKPEDIKETQLIKASTAEGYLKILQSFFNAFLYKENDIYSTPPADGISLEIDECRYGCYTDNEIQKIEKLALQIDEPWKKWSLLLAIYTGARLSEIIKFLNDGYKTDDTTGINYFYLEAGKTKHAKRPIPIHNKLIEYGILELNSINLKSSNISRFMKEVINELNIPKQDDNNYDKVFHSFRHTFITKCLDLNIPTPLIQTIVGHSKNLGITDTYNHSDSLKQLKQLNEEVIQKVIFS